MNEEVRQSLKEYGSGILEDVKTIESLQYKLEDVINTLLIKIDGIQIMMQTADIKGSELQKHLKQIDSSATNIKILFV